MKTDALPMAVISPMAQIMNLRFDYLRDNLKFELASMVQRAIIMRLSMKLIYLD